MKTYRFRTPFPHAALYGAMAALGLSAQQIHAQDMFDVYFLSDTTGSMGGLIGGVQSSSNAILSGLSGGGNVMFGVGEYKDGDSDAFGFRNNVAGFTSDIAAVQSGINAWGASGGGDTPEDNLLALYQVASTSAWRPGARHIIYWFGDAVGHDPASDGTTLGNVLDALNEFCIEVIAVDLNNLDGTGQATAITEGMRECGVDGGLIDAGELYALSLSGLSEEEIAEAVSDLILEAFINIGGGVGPGEAVRVIDSTLRTTSVMVARTSTRDVGGRLFKLRSGVRSEPISVPAPYVESAKGGMAKGGMAKTPVMMTETCPWEVWGQVYYSSEDQDQQFVRTVVGGTPGALTFANVLARRDTSIDTFGGTVGFDYDLNPNVTLGFAFGASRTDVDMTFVGSADIDTVVLMPYVSYVREMGSMAFYADALYGYGMNDYDTFRLPGAVGSTEGNFHTIELNTGLNMKAGQFVHGPYGQLRWLDGEIDSYTDSTGVIINKADYESLATQLGYQVSYQIQAGGGVIVPQARVAWEHEFEDNQGSVAGVPLATLDDDLAVVGTGVGYYTNCGWNASLDYEARLGSESESHYVGVKVGKEF